MLLFLPLLTGLLLVVSFPRASQGYLAWVAFIPLIAYIFRSKTPAQAFFGGFIAGAVELFTLLIWIPPVLAHYGGLPVPLAWAAHLLLISMLACYPAAACALTEHLVRRGGEPFLLLLPAVWVVFEYAQSLSPFGGFPWLLAGYTQSGYPNLIQIADVTGVYGISFLILGNNTAIVWMGLRRGRPLTVYGPLVVAGVLAAACIFYGKASLRRWGNADPNFRAAMLQGNISYDEPMQVLVDKLEQGYVRLADSLKPSSADLLVLPESPSPLSFQNDPAYRQTLETLARRTSLGLVFNNVSYREAEGGERYFNSACFLHRNGSLAGVYDKIHLVPFGEYVPLRRFFFFARTISKDVGDFFPGQDYRIVEIGGYPSNAVICFEAVFPELVRRFVEKGSQLIINLTNDGWYGDSAAPYQHLAITRLRAVENRRYVLRATNSGISAFIEPTGRIQTSTGLLQEAVCEGRFAFLAEKTIYTRYGDVFVFLCAIISCGSLIVAEMVYGESVSDTDGRDECSKNSITESTRSKRRYSKFEGIFDAERKRTQVLELEKKVARPEFWNDQEEAQTILQTRSRLEQDIQLDSKLARDVEDLKALAELADEGEDVLRDLANEVEKLEQEAQHTEIRMLLSGEHDASNAIVTIHPGAGGVESQDWAEMLVRMYLRYSERSGYATKMLDYQPGEEAGIKSATFLLEGEFAYGYLSSESGVHRLVRISPFGAMGKRQTSFASVFVYPELDDKIEIQIDEKDLRIDTYRSSGAGGQHVNVTDSAVRITHIPTGIVVSCQNERSQIRNREMARTVLRARLYELELNKKRQKLQAVEDSKLDIGWGSQIRSYVLHPYRMVKDHRTKYETSNADRVLDGDIEDFIYQYLVYRGVRRRG